jgi:hypothetical protein
MSKTKGIEIINSIRFSSDKKETKELLLKAVQN